MRDHAGKARDVAHSLFGIDRGQLAADLVQALDDAHGRVPVPGVVSGCEPGGPGAENRYVDDVVWVD